MSTPIARQRSGLAAQRAVLALHRQVHRTARGAGRPLVVLLGVGLALRILVTALYYPTALQWIDAVRYSRIGEWHRMFSDYYMPAGYALFLKVTHWISSYVVVTIGIQHALGLVAGILIYGAMRRAGGPRWLGLIPAAVPILVGDNLYIEHTLMNDALFEFMIVAGLAAALYGLLPKPDSRRLAMAGTIAGAAGLVRQSGLMLPFVVALAAATATPGSVVSKLRMASRVVLPAALVIGAYVAIALSFGGYTGLTDMGGWNLYDRVAPFANCNDFTPPAGTRILCEHTPPQLRDGPFEYAWVLNSRGQGTLGPATPANAGRPQAFAQAAIEAQPLDYLKAVVKDFVRYADPNVGQLRAGSGNSPETNSFEQAAVDPGTATGLVKLMGSYWKGLTPHIHALGVLDAYQTIVRIIGLAWWIFALLAVAGMIFARGAMRLGARLFGSSAFLIYLLPTMTLSWDWRYGVPPQVALVAGASCGAYGLWQRWAAEPPGHASSTHRPAAS